MTYTPEDTDNYNAVEDIEITLTVYPKAELINAAPVITANDKTLIVGDAFDAKADVTAKDAEDGDITQKIEVINNTVDTSKAGSYEVTYKVTDSQGASVTKTITVTVKAKDTLKPTPDRKNNPSGPSTDKNMKEWILRKEDLKSGVITRDEYFEWKINWPQTCDDCGKFEPKKQWRKHS